MTQLLHSPPSQALEPHTGRTWAVQPNCLGQGPAPACQAQLTCWLTNA